VTAVLAALLASLAAALALPGAHTRLPPPPAGAAPGADPARASGGPPETERGGPRWRLVAAAGAGFGVLLLVPGAAALPASAAVATLVWWRSAGWESAETRRRRELLEGQLPHVVDLMVAALAAGAAPGAALARVADVAGDPAADELRGHASRLALGADPVTVWRSLSAHPQLGRLGVTLLRSAESGAQVTGALTRLAEELRSRRRADVETRVRQVEVKAAVPLGVCLLPSFVLLGVVPLVAGSALGFVVVR
jgi:Flp pilus assembly protein TadB